MTAKFTPASITVNVPTDAVTLDAETVSALLAGSASRTALARVRNLLTPRTVTITAGTRVRLKVDPGHHPDFLYGMQGWDNDDVTVDYVTDMEVRARSPRGQDFTLYTGPFEKILDVLEVLGDKSPETQPEPTADAGGWIEWDFSNPAGPDLPEGSNVQVRFRGGVTTTGTRGVSDFYWGDACNADIVAYRIV